MKRVFNPTRICIIFTSETPYQKVERRGGGVEASSVALNRVSMIAIVKKFGRLRRSTGWWKTNMADFNEREAFLRYSQFLSISFVIK